MRVTDSILVSVNFDLKPGPDTDTAVLLVGKKKKERRGYLYFECFSGRRSHGVVE